MEPISQQCVSSDAGELIAEGQALLDSGSSFLSSMCGDPVWFKFRRNEAREREIAVRKWFNTVDLRLGPRLLTREDLKGRCRTCCNALLGWDPMERETLPPDFAKELFEQALNQALDLVRSVPEPADTQPSGSRGDTEDVGRIAPAYEPNTAFIIMAMDPNQPELEDIVTAYREVFAEFGIRAVRADEIEHQEVITQVILDRISRSEFLLADLSGERPNVYYEIGYAHALGKRPILFRKLGTKLHFDLAVHNAPEYRNVTDLRTKLRARLAALTGKD